MIKKNVLTIFIFIICATNIYAQTIDPSGLKIWLKSDTGVIVQLGKVTQWKDFSGNNNHCTQSDTSMAPIVVSNIASIGNRSSLLLDGADDYMIFTTQISDIRSMFFVIKKNGNNTPYEPLLGEADPSSYDFTGVANGPELFSDQYASPNIQNGIVRINTISAATPTLALKPTNYAIVTVLTTGNVSAKQLARDRANADRVWKGEYSEVIIYNRVLNAAGIDSIENYLVNKYSPAISLGPDIPIPPTTGCVPSFSVTITANPDFQSYLWSNGDVSNQTNVNQYGTYSVICTDIFGKQHFDTINVVPTPKNFQYPSSVLCQNSTLTWNTQLDHTTHVFNWQDSSNDSLFVISSVGQYYVKITDTFGCIYNSDTLTVTQDNFASTISLGPDVSLCSGNSITLTSGISSANSYTWSTSSTNDSLLITNTGQYSVIVTNTNNCVAKDTINVTVLGLAPIANFTTSIGCVNSSVAFTNSSVAPTGNTFTLTSWDFGDSNTSSLFNPSHTYTNTGTYTINVLVKTDASCSQSITKTINVYPVPTATFVSGIACQNDSTTFLNQSSSIIGYSIASSYWSFGDNTNSNLTSPKHVFSSFTNYTVKLITTNNVGCKDSIYKTVAVQSEVKANFINSPACINSPTNFQSTSIIPPSNTAYLWTGSFSGNTPIVSKTYTNSGVYYVTLAIDGGNGCTSSITKLINVYLPPVANFSVPSFCSKDTISTSDLSNAQSGVISSYNWRLNNTTFSSAQSPSVSLTTAGTYSVRLTVINSFGCKDSTTKSFIVYPLPLVDFTSNPTSFFYINEPVNFIPSITNASSYLWNITGAPTSTVQIPTQIFSNEGTYTVTLNLKDQQGCKNTKTKAITVTNRHLDLAILNVTTTKDIDGFMTVIADLANYGSVPIYTFNAHYQISDAGNIKETWTGTLAPHSFYEYTFNAKSASLENSTNNITCVEIEKVNGITDDNIDNNYFCNALNANDIFVSNPIPNPSIGDVVLPITLNRDIDYTIVIYNSLGQIQYDETTIRGIAGLNFVTLSTSSYARGCYIIKVMIDSKTFIKKFIKTSSE